MNNKILNSYINYICGETDTFLFDDNIFYSTYNYYNFDLNLR